MTFSKNDQRRVLLIDHDFRSQQLRVTALRNCEIEVDSASNIDEAARLCARHSYNLVLLAAQQNSQEAVLLSAELKKWKPRQRMALFVGAPEYIHEVGRNAPDSVATRRSTTVINNGETPHSHWHLMLECLLATA
jgi:DNA-binding NtrC family response regulator